VLYSNTKENKTDQW